MALPHGRKRPIKMIEPLRIFQWNSRSLFRAQLEEFRAMYFPLTKKAPGEGVTIIAIKESLRIWKLKLTSINNFETIGITIELLDGTKVDIISAYCCNGNICYRDDINLLFSSTGNTAIIGGDFNSKRTWPPTLQPNQGLSWLKEDTDSDICVCCTLYYYVNNLTEE